MAQSVLIDQFHLTVFVPKGLPESECRAVRRTLNNRRLHQRLRQGIRAVFSEYPTLAKIRLTISR